jgi:hypothetical protein
LDKEKLEEGRYDWNRRRGGLIGQGGGGEV